MTPTAILSTVCRSFRMKRTREGGAADQLRNLDQHSTDFTVRQLAYGVLWADWTGRITGTASLALRRATPWQAAQLIAAMIRDGITTIGEVSAWMNQNGVEAIG